MKIRAGILLLALAGACGQGSGDKKLKAKDLPDLIVASSLQSRSFVTTVTTPDQTFNLKGSVKDDQRWKVSVSSDKPLFEEVTSDDQRFINAHVQIGDLPMDTWVVDPNGTPGWFERQQRRSLIDPKISQRTVRLLETLPVKLAALRSLAEHNPDGATYIPAEDKFKSPKRQGTRFDAKPKAFDSSAIVVTLDSVAAHFTWISIWIKDNKISRVDELLELPDPKDKTWRDFYTQLSKAKQVVDPSGLVAPPNRIRGFTLRTSTVFEYSNSPVELPTAIEHSLFEVSTDEQVL